MIAEDGEAHPAEVAGALLLAAAPEQALVVVRDDVVAKSNVVRAIFDVEEAVIPVDLPAPEERVRCYRRGAGVLEDIPV
jgi:hypothetical protein